MKDQTVKKTIEIEVPLFWETHPNVDYDEIRKKIYSRWALIKYLTGKTAEEWLWKTDSHLYKNGGVAFLDATKAIEEAFEAMLKRISKRKIIKRSP